MAYPPEAWTRLGQLLAARRAHIHPRYRIVKNFVEVVKVEGVSLKLVSDIENNARQNYRAATIALIEQAYRLVPGSIYAVTLQGGDLIPISGLEVRQIPQPDDVEIFVVEMRTLADGIPAEDRDRALTAAINAARAVLKAMARDAE